MPLSTLAGSAIAQGPNVGRVDKWDEWRPTPHRTKWLILAGASDPPNNVYTSDRRPRDKPSDKAGKFLHGINRDFVNIEDTIDKGSQLLTFHNRLNSLDASRQDVFTKIKNLFDVCKKDKTQPVLYYTGHGETGTGDWCMSDGTIRIQEIVNMLPEGCLYPMIFSDCCFSGHWANFCIRKRINDFHCLAACPAHNTALDSKGEGGDLTLFMTGKKVALNPDWRPRTEPMYSGGDRATFPVTKEYRSTRYE